MGRRNRKRRSPEERQQLTLRRFHRFVVIPLRVLILLVFGAGVGIGAWQLYRLACTSPVLAVRTIDVIGAKRTKVETILRESGLEPGVNIFAVDLELAERRLGALPWIREVSVIRDVPRRLLVKITEHEPVAAILLGGLYYLDRNGTVFKRVQPNETVDLPVLTGLTREQYQKEPEPSTRRILGSLQLLARFRRDACLSKMGVSEIHHDPLMGFTAVLDPGALSVRLGTEPVDHKLGKLCNLLAEIGSRNLRPHTILLDQEERPGWATVSLDTSQSNLLAGNAEEPKDEVSHGEEQ